MSTLREWAREHPAQAALRGAWIVFVFVVGAAFGAGLAWGPLTIDPPLNYAVGLLAGLALAGLWAWQQWAAITGRPRIARRWRAGLIVAPLAGLLVLAGVTAKQMIDIGAWPALGENRLGAFDRLWRAMRDNYPFFDLKGVDWDAVYARYRPQVESAHTEDAYFAAVASMLAELNDGHTELSSPQSDLACYGDMVEIEGVAVVNGIGATARAAGLSRGDAVRQINNRSIDAAIAQLDRRLRDGSTPWQQRATGMFHLLCAPPDQPIALDVETVGGERREIILAPVANPPPPTAAQSHSRGPLVTGERLPSGFGLIRVPAFFNRDGHDVVAEFDAALDTLMDAPGIILDLRGNGGGNTSVAHGVAGRFHRQSFRYIRQTFRQPTLMRGWRTTTYWQVEPRGPIYDRPVVLIIDVTNASSAEDFIVSMVDGGRARSVGRLTGGMSGNPVSMALPGGGVARFSTGDIRRMDGRRIEGAGIMPDVMVTWTLDDFRVGRDPDLDAAVALLQQSTTAP